MAKYPKFRSHEVEDVLEALKGMSAKQQREALSDIKKGRVPGMSRKEIKALERPIEKIEKNLEGGFQPGATAAGIKDFFTNKRAKPPTGRSSWW